MTQHTTHAYDVVSRRRYRPLYGHYAHADDDDANDNYTSGHKEIELYDGTKCDTVWLKGESVSAVGSVWRDDHRAHENPDK